jgi:predicted GNAT family acetyltransferase
MADIKAIPLRVNADSKLFEFEVDGQKSSVNFDIEGDKIYLAHAVVPTEQRNRGIAGTMVEKVLQYVEDHNLKAVPMCSYIQAYIHRHPDWKRVVAQEKRPSN